MEEAADDPVKDDGDDDSAVEQHGACGRFSERLGGQLLLKVITGLEEGAAHSLMQGLKPRVLLNAVFGTTEVVP
jgi:hypothetical protein